MNLNYFQKFEEHLKEGRRQEAKIIINKFIQSFKNNEERRNWVTGYLNNEHSTQIIFYTLYEELIFPVLVEGFRKNDLWSILALARTCDSINNGGGQLYKEIDYLADLGLLLRAYEIDSNSEEVRKALLDKLLSYFSHCYHELPHGILMGNNGATYEDCEKLSEQLSLAKKLDENNDHADLLNEYIKYLEIYQKSLS